MAQATTTTPGTIVLAGDLTGGSAYSPQLSPTGVNPGENAMYRKMYVDSKGRTVWISPSLLDLPEIGLASTAAYGKVKVGENMEINASGLSVKLPIATEGQIGILQPGNGLDVNSGGLVSVNYSEFGDTSTSTLGFMQVGTGFELLDGTISFDYTTIATASESEKGLVQIESIPGVDDILSVSNGIISANYSFIPSATTTSKGKIKSNVSDTVFSITNGVASYNIANYPYATTLTKGLIKIGTGFEYDGTSLGFNYTTIPTATDLVKGVVQIEEPVIIPIPGGTSGWKTTYESICLLVEADGTVSVNPAIQANPHIDPYDRITWILEADNDSPGSENPGGLFALGPSFTTDVNGAIKFNLDEGPIQALKYNAAEHLYAHRYQKGVVKVGTGFNVDSSGHLSLNYSQFGDTSTTSLGFMQVGSGLSVSNGVVSYTYVDMPNATTSSSGAVQIGSGLLVDGNGVISKDVVPTTSTTVMGLAQIGTGLKLELDSLAIDTEVSDYFATDLQAGFVQVGSNMSINNGVLSAYYSDMPASTTTSLGAVQVGSGLSVINGTISLPIATTSEKGLVQISSTGGIEVNAGVISSNFTRTANLSQYGIVKIGTTASTSRSVLDYVNNTISLPIASDSVFGVASLGYGLERPNPLFTDVQLNNSEATASVQEATTSSKGIMQVGTGLQVGSGATAGQISLDINSLVATTSEKGFIQVGDGFSVTSGVISANNSTFSPLIPIANSTNAGLVKGRPDTSTYFYMNGEYLTFDPSLRTYLNSFTYSEATTTAKGKVQIGDGFSVTGGVVSAEIATTSTNGLIKLGYGVTSSSGSLIMDSQYLKIADSSYLTSGTISYSNSVMTPAQINSASWVTSADHAEEIYIDLEADITSFPSTQSPITNITYYNSGGFTISGFAANYKFNQAFSTAPIGTYGSFTIVNDGTNCFVIQ